MVHYSGSDWNHRYRICLGLERKDANSRDGMDILADHSFHDLWHRLRCLGCTAAAQYCSPGPDCRILGEGLGHIRSKLQAMGAVGSRRVAHTRRRTRDNGIETVFADTMTHNAGVVRPIDVVTLGTHYVNVRQ